MTSRTSPAPSGRLAFVPAWFDARPEAAVAVAYGVGGFITILDTTIVGVALPAMARDFAVSTASIGWVVVGYLVSMAVWIPASGWIGDRAGTKRVFLAAVALFTIASLLCGLSRSLEQLIAFRILQGAASGMVTPVATAMLFRAFPPERRARAAMILIIPTSIGPALGPLIGGLLVDALSWHWIFWVNGPVGLLLVLFGLRFLHEHREAQPGRFDLPGFALSGVGLALTLFALTEGSSRGWGSLTVVAAGVGGIAALVALVVVELWRPEPLLNLRLLRDRLFGLTNLASFFGWAAYLGWLFLMPLFLQQVHGVSPTESGFTTFVEAVGVLSGSRVVGRLYPRIGPRRLIAGGMAGIATAVLLCTRLTETTDTNLIRLLIFSCGCSMSAVILSLNTSTFARISHSDTGRASAIFNTQRRTAAAFGVAVMATILTGVGPTVPEGGGPILGPVLLPAFQAAFVGAASFAIVGMLIALQIHDADAADTMRRKPA